MVIEHGEGGVIGGTGDTYGIDNTGTIEAINTNSSSVIKGNEAGIYNETGGVLVGTGITGTGTTEGNYGIENAGTIADILSINKRNNKCDIQHRGDIRDIDKIRSRAQLPRQRRNNRLDRKWKKRRRKCIWNRQRGHNKRNK